MAFIPCVFGMILRVHFDNQGEPAQNTFHFRQVSSVYTISNITNKINAFIAWWDAYIKPVTVSTVALTHLQGIALDSTSGAQVLQYLPTPLAGIHGGDPMPQNVTVAVGWRTATHTRSAMGRSYVIGLPSAAQVAGRLDLTWLSDLQTRWGTYINVFTVYPHFPCVVSYQHNGVPLDTADKYDILSCSINRDLDSMRRRLPGR